MISRYLKFRPNASYLLLGPRQTGKTSYLKECYPDAWKVNLLLTSDYLRYSKDPDLFRKEALFQLQKKQTKTIVIDEVQKLPSLLDEVHFLIEEFPEANFILTGSSARKLKRSSVNLLAGRAISKKMYPFILPEIQKEVESLTLDELLRFGTLPGVFLKDPALKSEVLRTYVETYLKEEILAEGLVRNLPQFAHFLDVAAQSFTEVLNYSKIGRQCNQSPRTTQNYFDILEDTLIGYRLLSWSESKRKQLESHPKFYFFDNGVTSALLSRLIDPLDPALRGRLFEQWVINEVRARVDYDRRDVQLYSWREQAGVEVDLMAARGKNPLFAAEIKSFEKLSWRHFEGLKALQKDYPELPLYLICTTPNPYREGDVTVLSWKHFLLEELPKY
jgi:uncharacterized protein